MRSPPRLEGVRQAKEDMYVWEADMSPTRRVETFTEVVGVCSDVWLAVFSKVFVFTFFIRLANLFYRRNLRDVYWTSMTNNLMSYPMHHSYNSCCCLMQIYRITCPHYQMKMITSTNIM
jgi:hypothetical protein